MQKYWQQVAHAKAEKMYVANRQMAFAKHNGTPKGVFRGNYSRQMAFAKAKKLGKWRLQRPKNLGKWRLQRQKIRQMAFAKAKN